MLLRSFLDGKMYKNVAVDAMAPKQNVLLTVKLINVIKTSISMQKENSQISLYTLLRCANLVPVQYISIYLVPV